MHCTNSEFIAHKASLDKMHLSIKCLRGTHIVLLSVDKHVTTKLFQKYPVGADKKPNSNNLINSSNRQTLSTIKS